MLTNKHYDIFQDDMNTIPTVKVTYKGKPLTEKYYREHKEIRQLYPTAEAFMNRIYLPLLQRMEEINERLVLEISENRIEINGIRQVLY